MQIPRGARQHRCQAPKRFGSSAREPRRQHRCQAPIGSAPQGGPPSSVLVPGTWRCGAGCGGEPPGLRVEAELVEGAVELLGVVVDAEGARLEELVGAVAAAQEADREHAGAAGG